MQRVMRCVFNFNVYQTTRCVSLTDNEIHVFSSKHRSLGIFYIHGHLYVSVCVYCYMYLYLYSRILRNRNFRGRRYIWINHSGASPFLQLFRKIKFCIRNRKIYKGIKVITILRKQGKFVIKMNNIEIGLNWI